RKKGKRRSPRRRSTTGRSADSGAGERLKEWRERDLQERSARLAAAAGGGLRRHRASVSRKDLGLGGPAVKAGRVEIVEPISVKSLSAATGLKSAVIIRKLMERGTLATVNQTVGVELAEAIIADFDIELVVRRAKTAEEELVERLAAREVGGKQPRAPVVTFLGHVDHGKTSLLDRIRHTAVAPGEAGGITQHIGAYRYDMEDKHVVFLDTPGHEAFTAMRARGANMTDVVVLVVAADDGVMPQTVEAISHARAAEVPIVVALNKIDVPNANVQRAMGQLAEKKLQPREWGGDIEVIQTSAETGQGIGELVEVLSLEAELLELTAEPHAPATGYVIEAEMDPGRGALARLLIRNGTLKVGNILLAGRGYGRIRQIKDDKGKEIDQAGPSTPVEVAGLDEAPAAGDRFYIVHDIDDARQVAEDRRQRARAEHLGTSTRVTLEGLLSQIEAGEVSEVPLIVKADVQGSIEALRGSLEKLSTGEIRVNILHAAVGGISTGDVTLAEASGAIIIGFNVVPDAAARQLAERAGVDIRAYRVIYDIVDDMRSVLEGGLAPEIREETLGRAEVRQVFKVSRVGSIAGCYVTDGLVSRSCLVRITRDNIVVEDERSLDSLRRFKDDAREVRAGLECGLKISGYDDIKEGDILEFYQKVEVARKL
ncbi:MAG: translation initiation factor IF-2, partial [Phycisphaerae bacterium]